MCCSESCPTKILLPNEEADKSGTGEVLGPRDIYALFGLNDAEIDIVADRAEEARLLRHLARRPAPVRARPRPDRARLYRRLRERGCRRDQGAYRPSMARLAVRLARATRSDPCACGFALIAVFALASLAAIRPAAAVVVTCTNCGTEFTQLANNLQLADQLARQVELVQNAHQALRQSAAQYARARQTPIRRRARRAAQGHRGARQAKSLSFTATGSRRQIRREIQGLRRLYQGPARASRGFPANISNGRRTPIPAC